MIWHGQPHLAKTCRLDRGRATYSSMPTITVATERVRRLGLTILDAVLPPQCPGCGSAVDGVGRLCPECWRGIHFLAPPMCAACGFPFEFDIGDDALCAACAARPPPYRQARAVMRYDEASRGLLLGFKHGDRIDWAQTFGRWLARAGADLLAEADVVAPVPLHRWRLARRRYNQSALLAQAIARATGLPAAVDLLVRTRWTGSQRGGSSARLANVAGAFAVRARWRADLAGRRVVLVDDVLTTGATVEACARVLRRAGAARVDVLTLARVVRPASRIV